MAEHIEPDYDEPVSHADLAAVLDTVPRRLYVALENQNAKLASALELGRRFEREYQRMRGAAWHASAQMYLDNCQSEFIAAYTEALK